MDELRLFCLTFRYTDPRLSRALNYGENCGEVHESTKFVVDSSADNAVNIKWLAMEKEANAEVRTTLVKPEQKNEWRAVEVKVPGYKITVEKID